MIAWAGLTIHSKEGVFVSLRSHGLLSMHAPGQLHVTHLSHDLGRHVTVQKWAYEASSQASLYVDLYKCTYAFICDLALLSG